MLFRYISLFAMIMIVSLLHASDQEPLIDIGQKFNEKNYEAIVSFLQKSSSKVPTDQAKTYVEQVEKDNDAFKKKLRKLKLEHNALEKIGERLDGIKVNAYMQEQQHHKDQLDFNNLCSTLSVLQKTTELPQETWDGLNNKIDPWRTLITQEKSEHITKKKQLKQIKDLLRSKMRRNIKEQLTSGVSNAFACLAMLCCKAPCFYNVFALCCCPEDIEIEE